MSAMNPFLLPLKKLFSRINLLNGLLSVLDAQLRAVQDQIRKDVERGGGAPTIVSAHTVPVTDLEAKEPAFQGSGVFAVRDGAYIHALDEVMQRNAATTASQAYEAFETYVKDVTGAYLHQHQSLADTDEVTKFDANRVSKGLSRTTPEYWRAFMEFHCRGTRNNRDNEEYFRCLRRFAPDIARVENQNWRELDLPEWYAAASEVRHAITHADFTIKGNRIKDWSASKKGLLVHWFPCRSDGSSGYKLTMVRKDAEENLAVFDDYARLILKSLSEKDRLEWDFFNTTPLPE